MTDPRTTSNEQPAASNEADEESLVGLLIVVARHQKFIFWFTAGVALLTLIVVFLMPKIYTAKAVVLPPQDDQSGLSSMVMGALAGLVGGGGGGNLGIGGVGGGLGAALGLKSPGDIYVGMLNSRSIADAVIERFKLKEYYFDNAIRRYMPDILRSDVTMVATRKKLATNVTVTNGKDGLITVEVDDEDPQRAADMANAYIDELDKLTKRVAITEAAKRRLFVERQLRQTEEKLAQAEDALKLTQEKTGMLNVNNQGRTIIEAMGNLIALAAAKEVQIVAMQSFATPNNPALILAKNELNGLQEQISKFERTNVSGNGDIMVATGKMPSIGLEFVRKVRDVKYQQDLYELLAKQYEIARVDELRNSVVIQVVDPAVVLDKKTKPKRGLITILATLAAFIVAIAGAFLIEGWLRLQQDEEQLERINELRDLARWKGRRLRIPFLK